MYSLDHKSTPCAHRAMLVPFGRVKNSNLAEMSPGDVFSTYLDDPPKDCIVLASSKVPILSASTNAISMLIYGYPIETVMERLRKVYGNRIDGRFLYLITYKELCP